MKVGINLLPLRPGKNGGMEIYLRNLLEHLFRIDRDSHYYLITAPYNDASLDFSVPNCTKIPIHIEARIFQNIHLLFKKLFRKEVNSHATLEDIIKRYQFDVWFCPFLSLDPRPLSIPGIVTIPDIQHEFYPEYFSKEELSLRKSYIQPSCELATEIITISEFSKQTFVKKLGIDPSKVRVIHLAAGDNFSQSDQERNDIKTKYALPDYYFFYPANAWPHKNHQTLIIAFNLYRKTYGDSVHLVLSGSDLRNSKGIHDLISLYRLDDTIHILDYVEKEDMPGLYKNAKALVFPSLFEGFGIPLVEAMATGCPIIASNSTSIPEVAGDAAYLFDPKNPQSICDAMHRIVHDNELREKLIQNGKNRVTKYSYNTVARMHLDLFTSARTKAKDAETAYHNEEKVVLDGLYSDGWISRMEFRYIGPKRFRYVQMDLIGGLPVKYPMKITVILNKKKKTNVLIPALGKYSFEFEFPDSGEKNPEYSIGIIPERSYVPRKLAINNDEREISVILDALTLIDETATATQFIKKTI
jgi:glycosyltransferase involved in cell wall biosynthesis